MRRLINPRTRVPRVLVAVLAALFTLATVAVAPSAAAGADSAKSVAGSVVTVSLADLAPSGEPAPISKTQGFTVLEKPSAPLVAGKGKRFANAVFTCYYYAYVPAYVVDFQCIVSQGAIQLWVDCGGVRYYDPQIMFAVGTWYSRANCYPFTVTNFGALQLA